MPGTRLGPLLLRVAVAAPPLAPLQRAPLLERGVPALRLLPLLGATVLAGLVSGAPHLVLAEGILLRELLPGASGLLGGVQAERRGEQLVAGNPLPLAGLVLVGAVPALGPLVPAYAPVAPPPGAVAKEAYLPAVRSLHLQLGQAVAKAQPREELSIVALAHQPYAQLSPYP